MKATTKHMHVYVHRYMHWFNYIFAARVSSSNE